MTRIAAAILLAASAASAHAEPFALRPTVLVSSDLVRIGDLVVDIASDKADIAVFRAPDLGETGSVRVAAVIEALRPHDIDIAARGLSEVSVTRASRVIGGDEIRRRIAEIAAERLRVSDATSIAVTLDAPAPMLHLDPAETGPLMPLRMTFDARGGRFDLFFRSAGAPVRITGTAQETENAVVLVRARARGDVLGDSDVAIERRPKTGLQSDTIRDLSAAIGMALQQSLRPGQAIRSTDIARPQLVKRGEPVVLVYEVPGITLTARGKSEDMGSLGDTVSVLNIHSKRVIQGVVSAPGQVTVTSLTPRLTSATENLTTRHAAARTALTKAQ